MVEWAWLFEPFHQNYKHKILDSLGGTCITLFAHDEALGRLLLKRILSHQWLKPSSHSLQGAP